MSSNLHNIQEEATSDSFFEDKPNEYQTKTTEIVSNQLTSNKMFNAKTPVKKKEDVSGFIEMYERGIVSRLEKSKKIQEVKKQMEDDEIKDLREKPKVNPYPTNMGNKLGFMERLEDYQVKYQSNMKKLQSQIEEKRLQKQREIEAEMALKSKKVTQSEVDRVVNSILEKDNIIKEKKKRLHERILSAENKECVFQPKISHSYKYKEILDPSYGLNVMSIEHKNYVKRAHPENVTLVKTAKIKSQEKVTNKIKTVKYLDKDPKASMSTSNKNRIISSQEFRLGGRKEEKQIKSTNDNYINLKERFSKVSVVSVNSINSVSENSFNEQQHVNINICNERPNSIVTFHNTKPKKSTIAIHTESNPHTKLNKNHKVKFSVVVNNHSDSSIGENIRKEPFYIPELNEE